MHKAALLTALLLCGCVKIKRVVVDIPSAPNLPNMTPYAVRKIHVDVDFTPKEFALIAEAGERLYHETKGRILVQFLQDLDFRDRMTYIPMGHWRMMRLNAESQTTSDFDKAKNSRIYGLCRYEDKTLFMIPDRMPLERTFVHVAEHELLHSVGVQHTTDPYALMAQYIRDTIPLPLEFTDSDRQAFCLAFGCNPESIWPSK